MPSVPHKFKSEYSVSRTRKWQCIALHHLLRPRKAMGHNHSGTIRTRLGIKCDRRLPDIRL